LDTLATVHFLPFTAAYLGGQECGVGTTVAHGHAKPLGRPHRDVEAQGTCAGRRRVIHCAPIAATSEGSPGDLIRVSASRSVAAMVITPAALARLTTAA